MSAGNGHEVTEVPITESIRKLSGVDAHLASLYRRAAGAEGTTAVPTVRTVLLNLVAYCQTEKEADEATAGVSEILGAHPARAIIIEAMPPQPGEETHSVSVICGITRRGDRRLCGELIRIHSHEGADAAVGAVMPLLVADVPVFLWVMGEVPRSVPQFDELLRVANVVIVDSRRFANLEDGMTAVSQMNPAGPDRVVQDLAWISLQSWRELTAQHFDPPAVRPYVSKLSDVTIEYASGERKGSPPSCALLFAAWFASAAQLRIHVVSSIPEGGYRIQARQDDRDVDIRLVPGKGRLSPCQLVSVNVRCESEKGPATFVTRGISATELSITEECEGICFPPRVLGMTPQGEASLASQALDLNVPNHLYCRSLDWALQALRALREVARSPVREVSEYGREH